MWIELNLYGSLEGVQSTYAESKEVERSDPFSYDMWIFELSYFGHYDIALAEAKSDTTPFRSLWIAIVLDQMGDDEAARPYYEKSVEVFKNLSKSREYDVYQSMVSLSYGGLGQKEEAIKWGKMAMKTLPLSKDRFQGAEVVERYSEMLIFIGEYDEAIEKLEQLLSIPSSVTITSLKFKKFYDPLREHPRFIKLIAN